MSATLPATNRPQRLRHVAPIATSSTLAAIAALHAGWVRCVVPFLDHKRLADSVAGSTATP